MITRRWVLSSGEAKETQRQERNNMKDDLCLADGQHGLKKIYTRKTVLVVKCMASTNSVKLVDK